MAKTPYTGPLADEPKATQAGGKTPYNGEIVSPSSAPAAPASDPTKRTWGEVATDTLAETAQMTTGVVGGLAQAANVITGGAIDREIVKPLESGTRALLGAEPGARGIAGLTQDATDYLGSKKSAKRQAQLQEFGEAKGVVGTAKALITNPSLTADMAISQIPLLVGMGRRARGAQQSASRRALAAAPGDTAAAAAAGQRAAERSVTTSAAAVGGGFAANEAVQRAMQLPEETWQANPEYQALIAEGVDPQAAKERIANSAALPSLLTGAGINAAAMQLTKGIEARAFTGAATPAGVGRLLTTREGAKSLGKAVGLEAAEEGITEGGEQFGSNLGVRQIDPNQSLMEGVPEGVGAGMVLGGAVGGGIQVAGSALSRSPADVGREEVDQEPPAAAAPPAPAAPPPGTTVVDPAAGPNSKAIATVAAAERGDGVLAPVVAPDMQTTLADQQDQQQADQDLQARVKEGPAVEKATQAQAESIATGKDTGPRFNTLTDEEFDRALAPFAGKVMDANTQRTMTRSLNVRLEDLQAARARQRQAERAGSSAPAVTAPAQPAADAAPQKEVIRGQEQDLFAGQEGRQEGQREARQGLEADAGAQAVPGVAPDRRLRKALTDAPTGTGADGAQYTIRAFSNGDGFFVVRKTKTGSTQHKADNPAEPWSYRQAADQASKLAAQFKEQGDGRKGDNLAPGSDGQPAAADAAVGAGRKPSAADRAAPAADRGAKTQVAEPQQVAEGDGAPAAVRAEPGETAGGGAGQARAAGAEGRGGPGAEAGAGTAALEVVEHTTPKGKVLRGVWRADLSMAQAKEIDPYTFQRKGKGWFIREKHLAKMAPAAAPQADDADAERMWTQGGTSQRRAALAKAREDGTVRKGLTERVKWENLKPAEREALAAVMRADRDELEQAQAEMDSPAKAAWDQRIDAMDEATVRAYATALSLSGAARGDVDGLRGKLKAELPSELDAVDVPAAKKAAAPARAESAADRAYLTGPGQDVRERLKKDKPFRAALKKMGDPDITSEAGYNAAQGWDDAKAGRPADPAFRTDPEALFGSFDPVDSYISAYMAALGNDPREYRASVTGPLYETYGPNGDGAPPPDGDGQQDELDAEMQSYERGDRRAAEAETARRRAAPSANTIFTEDAYQAARKLLKSKLGQLNSGIDPEMLQAGITAAGYHIEKGARTFAAYTQAMLEDLGDSVRPYLKSWYMAVKYDPRATGFAEEMDTAATVEDANVERRAGAEERARIDALPEDQRDAEIRRLRAENAKLQKQVDMDARTGIKGPAAYDRDKANAGAVGAIDLTLFKAYNTLFRNAGGDAVLAAFGEAMREAGGDAAYRRGGDEFAFLTGTQAEAEAMIDRLREAVSRIEIVMQGADDGATYTISGVPFVAGAGTDENAAENDLAARKPKLDREGIPSNIRRSDDAGRADEGRAEAPRRQRKPAAEADRTLIQSWPNGIDGGGPGTTKHEFLKDARAYLKAAGAALEEAGWKAPLDRKGKAAKLVSVNEGGMAGSGDAYLNIESSDGAVKVMVNVGSGLFDPTKPSIRMTWTADGAPRGPGGKEGPNEWLNPGTTVAQLVDMLNNRLARGAAPAAAADTAQAVNDAMRQAAQAEGLEISDAAEAAQETENERDSEPAGSAGDGESGTQGEGAGQVSAAGSEPGTRDLFGPVGESDRGTNRSSGRPRARAAARRAADGAREGRGGNPGRGDQVGVGGHAFDGKPGSRNFNVPVGGLTREGSWLETARRNVDAMELAMKLEKEGRLATLEEQQVLAKYTGFGASEIANGLFRPFYGKTAKDYNPDLIQERGWREIGQRLKKLLTTDELATVMRSTQYAHYTSEDVTRSIWSALERMGFTGGKVLEPGMGTGNFPITAPETVAPFVAYTGLEMDHLTAAIGRQLVQGGLVLRADYTKQKLPKDHFDVAIGNPPFSSTIISADPEYRKHRFMLHDYFFAKTIDRVRPGGLLAFVTSAGTMNKGSEAARRYIADRADLVGAIRLPNTAFKQNAGTDVVTDIIFLRKRFPGEEPGGPAWMGLEEVEIRRADGSMGKAFINEYFETHPEMVLGNHALTSTMYRADSYTVEPDGDLAEQLKKAVKSLPAGILKPYEAVRDQEMTVEAYDRDLDPENRKEGGLYIKEGKVMVTRSGAGQPLSATEKLSPKEVAWVKDAIGLRDALKLALRDQLTNGDWKASLKALDDTYHAFVKKHGKINEFTESERTQRFYTDEDGREIALKPDQEAPDGYDAQERTITTRRYKNKKLLSLDVEAPLLIALEVEGDDGTFHPTKSLKQRSIQPPAPPRIESTHDALIVSLSRKGFLNIEHVAELANVSVDKAISDLGDRIYRNPIDGEWTMADAYLSGDVVTALEEAEAAARVDPTYRRNVEALRKVQPVPLTPRDITVSLGMAWVKPELINQFAREVLEAPQVRAEYEQNSGQWLVKGAERSKYQRAKDSEYSHADRSAPELLEAILNNREIKVTRTTKEDGKTRTYTDTEATTAVNEIAKKMRARFSTWVWEDADRAEATAKQYNTLRNRIIPRVFDGDFIDPPGLALRFKPDANGKGGLHPHQKRAIWRQVQTGDTYLAHAVGAGKTLEMIVGAMEQKRLGLISKPMFTVPNHMLGQFATEFLETYPAANIMVADEESFVGDKRRQFVAAATVNAPDAIIITHSALRLLRVKPETMQAVTADMVADLEAAIQHVGDNDRITRKKLENQLEKLTQRIEGKADDSKQDDVVFFEDMGVDMLYVDEAHEFRKLDFITNRQNVKGISPEGSAKALDLYAKVRFLHSQRPGRSHVFASGTPVTNTMGELYTVQKFMDYDAMREAGLHHFDAWASEYGEVVTEYERNAAGQYRPVERFAKFNNIPELMMQIRERMDVLTSTQLGQLVKRPDIIGGQPQMVVTEASEDLSAYMSAVLSPRIEASLKWKPSKDEPHNPDPMLAIIGDARLAVIDMRFVDPGAPSDPTSKLNMMVDQIIDKHGEFADVKLEGLKEPGATQIVFSPIGFGEAVAKRRGFDARAWINKRLRDAGIPPEHIAWIGDYKTNRKRKALFRDMRAGRVRILFGSPANMGTGVNVQNRLRWLHFLSPPWYPSDVEQPHGRILRQGNLNPEVGISWYVTEGTYDATGWGMVARKAKFIEQVMSGDKSQRSAEDLSEVSQYAMASALASGDDRAIRVAELEADIGRLRNLQGDHERMVHRARDDAWSAKNQIQGDTDRLARANAAVQFLGDDVVRSENFSLTLNGKPAVGADRTALAEQLMRTIRDVVPSAARIAMRDGFEQEIGLVNGKFPIVISARPGIGSSVRVDMDVVIGELNQSVFENERLEELPTTPAGALGITTRMMNTINGVRDIPAKLQAKIEENTERLAAAEKRRGAPWPQERELYEKVAELTRLQQEMAAEGDASAQTQQQTPTDQTQPPADEGGAQSSPEPGARASGPSETSLGVNDLRRAIDRIIRGWEGDAPIVKTIQAATELPAAAKRFDHWFDAEGWYDGKNTIYLVADNLPNITRAEQVLAHEAFGHYGVESITSAGAWAQIVADAARIRTMKNLSPAMRGAVDSAVRRYGNENPVQFARELLAVMAERGLRSSILGRLLAAVRRWARALGFKVDRWTEDELRAVVAAGIRSVERGGGGDGSRGTRGASFSATSPVFYSALAEAASRAEGAPKKGDAKAWKGWLDGAQRRGEFRQAERDWLGVDAWLDGRGTTTREELAEFISANQVQVQDVVLGAKGGLGEIQAAFRSAGYGIEFDPNEMDDGGAMYTDPDGEDIEFDDLPGDLQDIINANSTAAGDRIDGETKFGNYQLPGGKNYRELLLTLPPAAVEPDGLTRYTHEQIRAEMDNLALAETDEEAEVVAARLREMRAANRTAGPPPEMRAREQEFRSSHFDQPNILAHVRFNERTDADGKRVLFIEEIQSDWHQQGRKKGYSAASKKVDVPEMQAWVDSRVDSTNFNWMVVEKDTQELVGLYLAGTAEQAIEFAAAEVRGDNPGGVPNAPFKATDEWAMLAFKRMARWAVDNGFDRIAWTTGEQQAERYDLSKQVDSILVTPRGAGTDMKRRVAIQAGGSTTIITFDVDTDGVVGNTTDHNAHLRGKKLDEVVGKEMAEKIMATEEKHEFTGVELKVGGDGMRAFYDKILPSAVNKWAKKMGGRVGETKVMPSSMLPHNTKRQPVSVHSIDVTDAMREAVSEGLPAFSLRDPGAAVDRLGAALANPKQIAKDKFADMEPKLLGLLTLDQLADVSKNFAPQVKRYANAVLKMQTRRNQLQERSGALAEKWQGWQAKNRKEAEAMVGVMHDATIAGVDPAEDFVTGVFALHTGESMSLADPKAIHQRITDMSRAAREAGKDDVIDRLREDRKRLMKEIKVEEARVAAYPGLVARFARLPEDAQNLYREVRDEYRDRSEATQLALLERIGGLQIPGKEKAKLSDQVRTMFESARVHAPYFPLARFGEYWLSASMMVDGKPETSFHLAETKADRDRIETELKAEGWTIKARGVKLDNVKAVDGASGSFVANVIQQLRVAGVDDQIQDEVYQLYLRTLPDLSVRKNFIHRKKTAGYSNDALRAFAGHMNHGAHQLARLENSPFLEAEIEDLRKAAKAAAEDEGNVGDKMARAYNELTKRHEWVMNPQDAGWVQKVSSLNFMWYLGVSPAAALINLLQTWNVSYPVLASKFGWGKALGEINKAMAATIRTGGNIAKTAATEDERQALQALQDMGAIDKTLAHDLAGIGDTESTDFNPVQRKVMKFVSFLFHKAEVVNREATGLAAFRMAIADGQSFQQAVDLAADVIHQTHFNYSNANRARFMQGNAAKVIFAFKQYSQNMTYFLWRQFYQSIKGATPEEKTAARKALLGTLGMTSIYSGALGMPLMSVMFGIANAMAAAFGDDDEPWDAETEFRNWLADTLGPDLGRIAQVGVVQGGLSALGLPAPSISERVSLNNLWFRDPDMALEGRDLYNYWLEQVAGPVGGMFASAFTGASLFAEGLEKGDPSFLWRGVEASIPKAARDSLRAMRYGAEGANTLRGDPLVEDVGVAEALVQGLGFTPARISEAYEVNRAVKGYEKHIEDRRSVLLDAYALAIAQRDPAAAREVLAKIKVFNRRHRGMAISTETIKRSLASRRQYSEQAVNGIVVSRRIPEAREAGRFFADE